MKVLLIEDDANDAELIRLTFTRAKNVQIDLERSDRLSFALERLAAEPFDVVVSDLGLPDSRGIETFLKIHRQCPDTPVIVLTGFGDEDLAIKAVQSGAQDYLVKGHVDGNLLVRSMRYSMERQKLVTRLEKSLKEISTLRGLIPVCAWCRKMRDDKGYWKRVETYLQEHTEATFTHGICPECLKKVDPGTFKAIMERKPELMESRKCTKEQRAGGNPIKILLIEDNRADADLILDMLSAGFLCAEIKHSGSLSSAIGHLAREKFDIVLSGLSLPDSEGVETFTKIYALDPATPIIVLAGSLEEEAASDAVGNGAQDYLVKGQFDGGALLKAIRSSMARQKFMTGSAIDRKDLRKEGEAFYEH